MCMYICTHVCLHLDVSYTRKYELKQHSFLNVQSPALLLPQHIWRARGEKGEGEGRERGDRNRERRRKGENGVKRERVGREDIRG